MTKSTKDTKLKRTLPWIIVTILLGVLVGYGSFLLFERFEGEEELKQTRQHDWRGTRPDEEVLPETGPDEDETLTEVGKWMRYEVSLSNPSWSGNPFDLEFQGVFTHVSSGRKVTQLGFYAGGNVWKIYFMPDELGEWTFKTESSDADLSGKTGSFLSIPSDHPGRLLSDGNRWKFSDSGEYVSPMILATREWFKATETKNGIGDFIRWADEKAGSMIIGTTLTYFNHKQDEMPYLKGQEGIYFNIEMWDRLNSHYDALRDCGMGFYIMFFSDDEESPNLYNIKAQSKEEIRLFRYAVARFSAYPMVMWDTGIDIGEYRNNSWIDWFVDWFLKHDPWKHPVSSRTGGGSGGKFPAKANYYSDGAKELPSYSQIVSTWKDRSVPTAYTDRWRENYSRGNFDPAKIRRAAWEVGLVGGPVIYFSGNETHGYLNSNYTKDLEAAPTLGYRQRFFREYIQDFGKLEPKDSLLTEGKNVVLVTNPGKEYVAYSYEGGKIGIDLKDVAGDISVTWFNPRTGESISTENTSGGKVRTFNAPDNKDWALHLVAVCPVDPPGVVGAVIAPPTGMGFNIFIPMILDFEGKSITSPDC
jgi:hypothetical protein